MTRLEAIMESARCNLALHVEHWFECWAIGDVLGMRIAQAGARRCEHVLRLAEALGR